MSEVDNVKMRQAWIDDEIAKLEQELECKNDDAFLRLSTSLILECPPEDIDPGDIVDGGADKQLDVIHIEDDQTKGLAAISIFQSKNQTSFESNTVIRIGNGLEWIFEVPRNEVQKLPNARLKNKILEIRELRSSYGATNLSISVYHVTKGDSSSLSDEYKSEAEKLVNKFSKAGFGDFQFHKFGAHELIEKIEAGDIHRRQVNVDIPIIYDANRPSVISFEQGDTKSLICTVSGRDLAIAASTEPRDAIFDLNVRPYYGIRGKVNKEILATCTNEGSRFWFLNNGVTMVCDKYDLVSDPDAPKVKITNAQIVNGCQTTVTIREAFENKTLGPEVRVLLRVYSTDNPTLVDKITLSTNNQNKITDRDLRANDPVQRDIERIMIEKYGYFYERKNRQHRSFRGEKRKLIVPSPKAAQAYLAVVRGKPSNARGYLAAVWSDFYSEIFSNASVADLLLSFKILQYCQTQAKSYDEMNATTIESETRVYGSNHIARVMGYLINERRWGNASTSVVEALILDRSLEKIFADSYQSALEVCLAIRENDKADSPIPALYYKNSSSQKKVNAALSSLVPRI